MFNLAIDSKLRGCDIVAIRIEDVAASGYTADRATLGVPPLRAMFPLLRLRRHTWWEQGRKHEALSVGSAGVKFIATAGRVAATGGENGRRRSLDWADPTLTCANIRGASSLGMAVGAGPNGGFGLVREFGGIGQPIGSRNAAGEIVIVTSLDPEIDRAGITLDRMRFNDAGAE
jgi:hypothetical protein